MEVNCTHCRERFKSTPVILPCGWSVCDIHLAKSSSGFACTKCSAFHTSSVAYTVNRSLEIRLSFANAQSRLDQTIQRLSEFREVKRDPHKYVDSFFNEFLLTVDLREGEAIEAVQAHFSQMRNEINLAKSRFDYLKSDKGEFKNFESIDVESLQKLMDEFRTEIDTQSARAAPNLCLTDLQSVQVKLNAIEKKLRKALSVFLNKNEFKWTEKSSVLHTRDVFGCFVVLKSDNVEAAANMQSIETLFGRNVLRENRYEKRKLGEIVLDAYASLGNDQTSLNERVELLVLYEKLGLGDSVVFANCLKEVAFAFQRLKDEASAKKFILRSLQAYKRANSGDCVELGKFKKKGLTFYVRSYIITIKSKRLNS